MATVLSRTFLCFAIVAFLCIHVAEAAAGIPLFDFATYFGGTRDDAVSAIAIDRSGNIYVAGSTNSADLPITPDSYHPQFIGTRFVAGRYMGLTLYWYHSDVFVAKLSPTGSLLWSTYVGGTNCWATKSFCPTT